MPVNLDVTIDLLETFNEPWLAAQNCRHACDDPGNRCFRIWHQSGSDIARSKIFSQRSLNVLLNCRCQISFHEFMNALCTSTSMQIGCNCSRCRGGQLI